MSTEELEKEQRDISQKQKDIFENNDAIWKGVHVSRSVSRGVGLQQLAENAKQLMELARRERDIYFELLRLEKP
jgi:hypothetical protein